MVCVLVLLLLASYGTEKCEGRGGRGNKYVEPQSEERTYPSKKTGDKYYSYYMEYFTPAGMAYAVSGLNNPRTVTICSNYEPYFGNGTYLGEFPCPMETDPDTFSHCCGDNGYEFCCRAIDSRSVRVGIGLGCAAVLGLGIAFVACIVIHVQEKRNYRDSRKRNQQHMQLRGIPHYDEQKTRRYTAKQSYDGYQVLVTFHNKRFYNQFYEALRMKYTDISWRYDELHQVTEGKISHSEDEWVSLILSDDYEGSPIMIVMREQAAVEWMQCEYNEIVSNIPDERGFFSCCSRSHSNKTHPTPTRDMKTIPGSNTKDRNDNHGNNNAHHLDKSDQSLATAEKVTNSDQSQHKPPTSDQTNDKTRIVEKF